VRLLAAQLFEQDMDARRIAMILLVSTKPVTQLRGPQHLNRSLLIRDVEVQASARCDRVDQGLHCRGGGS
jgi:hypothetical protein